MNITAVASKSPELHQSITVLPKPEVLVQDSEVIKVWAAVPIDDQSKQYIGIGYTTTKSGIACPGSNHFRLHHCVTVKGCIADNTVYEKNVSTELPLAGLRTAVAERRATKTVKARF